MVKRHISGGVVLSLLAVSLLSTRVRADSEPSPEYTKLIGCVAYFELEEAAEKAESGDSMTAALLGAMAGDLQARAEKVGAAEERDAEQVESDVDSAKTHINNQSNERSGANLEAYFKLLGDMCYELSEAS